MTGTIDWSFSADKCIRTCQRNFFLRYLGAWHNSRDPVRKEAFLLKQVKTPELWQGNLVHRGIELFVVPDLQANRPIDLARAIGLTTDMARRQFAFSAARRYREGQMTKAEAGDDYCALTCHEPGRDPEGPVLDSAIETIERSLTNLAQMHDLLSGIRGRKSWPELEVRVSYDVAAIQVRIDLLFFKEFGKPTIVDWKISESQGGGDADLQTALYAWALCQHPKWRVQRAEDCELLEVQLLRNTILSHRVDQATFDRLEDRIYRSLDRMLGLAASDGFDLANIDRFDFAANPNSCVFCSMRPLCQQLAAQGGQVSQPAPEMTRARRKKAHACPHPQLF
ncbi:MAG: PD-(D/E)XK nuclease family protein [Planctomycetes bacterium]|nr:PD-(D/E)XK nuclease family protein [Planctomycetota bacterium]